MMSGTGQLRPRTALVVGTCVLVLLICDLVARRHGFQMPPVEWFFVGLSIGTLFHELGHLMFAAIGSMPIRLMSVGRGPLLWRRRYGETWFELRVVPIEGFVRPYALVNYRWYWWMLFLLGGVLGNVAVICLMAGLEAVGAAPDKAGDVLGPIVFAQVLFIVVNMVPWRGSDGIDSDGMQLLQLLWRRQDETAQLREWYTKSLSGYSDGNLQLTMNSASSRILYHWISFKSTDPRHAALPRKRCRASWRLAIWRPRKRCWCSMLLPPMGLFPVTPRFCHIWTIGRGRL